jgi:integrase
MALTVRAVDSAKPKDKPYKLADEKGLYLYVSTAGGKSWRANFTTGGKQQTRTYGRYPAMSLADARRVHQQAKESPQEAAKPTTPTFEDIAKEWLRKTLPSLSNPKHRGQVEATLEKWAYPKIGGKPIDQIERTELVQVVQSVPTGDKLVETAHRVAGRITSVFDYAQDVGYISKHPAAHLTRVLTARKTKKPMASIPPGEAGELLRAIMSYPEKVTRLALLLLAHTFVRVGELRGMRMDEFKEDGWIWVVPEERMKLKLPHVVPLTKQSKAIVDELKSLSSGSLVIDSPALPGHPISENTMLFALYRLGYRGRMTAHGFRALASTVLNEQSGFPHDVIERQLAHKETDAVRAAYNRAEYLPQRRELMAWWSDWLQRTTEAPPAASE